MKIDPNWPILPNYLGIFFIMAPAMLKLFGGGNSYIILMFIPILGEDEPILTSIFFKWVGWNHQPGCYLCSALIWWKNDPNFYSSVEASTGFFCVSKTSQAKWEAKKWFLPK